jgi:hypothetical protein
MIRGKKMRNFIVIVASLVFFNGCSNSEINSLDNAEGKTKLGFFGKNVYIGEHQGKRYWKIVLRKDAFLELNILNEKNHISMKGSDGRGGGIMNYGISADGKTLIIGENDKIPAMKLEILGKKGDNAYKASITTLRSSVWQGEIVELETL